jgi:hypothetical protein
MLSWRPFAIATASIGIGRNLTMDMFGWKPAPADRPDFLDFPPAPAEAGPDE